MQGVEMLWDAWEMLAPLFLRALFHGRQETDLGPPGAGEGKPGIYPRTHLQEAVPPGISTRKPPPKVSEAEELEGGGAMVCTQLQALAKGHQASLLSRLPWCHRDFSRLVPPLPAPFSQDQHPHRNGTTSAFPWSME